MKALLLLVSLILSGLGLAEEKIVVDSGNLPFQWNLEYRYPLQADEAQKRGIKFESVLVSIDTRDKTFKVLTNQKNYPNGEKVKLSKEGHKIHPFVMPVDDPYQGVTVEGFKLTSESLSKIQEVLVPVFEGGIKFRRAKMGGKGDPQMMNVMGSAGTYIIKAEEEYSLSISGGHSGAMNAKKAFREVVKILSPQAPNLMKLLSEEQKVKTTPPSLRDRTPSKE